MYDNKIRLSQDVLEKAQMIALEWGLKNPRAAVEAVFRRYADEYLGAPRRAEELTSPSRSIASTPPKAVSFANCEALSELDDLLGL